MADIGNRRDDEPVKTNEMRAQTRSGHAQHDPTLIAAHAADDLSGVELERARAQTSACMACAALEADLRALAVATRRADLPIPPLRRDFRLTPDDAARLRPTGWRRILAAFATPRLSFTQPLAAGLTTLGVAGLLLAALPSAVPTGSPAQAPASDAMEFGAEGEFRSLAGDADPLPSAAGSAAPASVDPGEDTEVAARSASAAASAAAAAPSGSAVAPSDASAAPSVSTDNAGTAAGRGSPAPQRGDDEGAVSGAGTATPPSPLATANREPPMILVVLAGSLLIAGLGLYALRWLGRRLA